MIRIQMSLDLERALDETGVFESEVMARPARARRWSSRYPGKLVPGFSLALLLAGCATSTATSVDMSAWVQLQDPINGLEASFPPDWYRAESPLTPNLGVRDGSLDPAYSNVLEILSVGTFPLRPGGPNCAQFPVNAVEDLGPSDVLITLFEVTGGPGVSQSTLGSRPPPGSHNIDESVQCLVEPKKFDRWFFDFSKNNRGFYAYVAMGTKVSEERANVAWNILSEIDLGQGNFHPSS